MSRRTALRHGLAGTALLAAALLGGCGVRWVPHPEPTPTLTPGPDDLAREQAVADARELLALSLALAAEPVPQPLAAALEEAVQESRAHLRALGAEPAATPGPAEAGAGEPSPTGPVATPPPPSPAPPPAPAEVVAVAADGARRALEATADTGPGTARLLGSLATARATRARALAAAAGLPLPEPPRPPAPGFPGAASGPPAPGAGAAPDAVPDALQRALAGEHSAVHAFGLIAGRLPPEQRPAALAAREAHLAARGRLAALVAAGGAVPTPAEPGYDVEVADPGAAAALAVGVEQRLAAAYADLVATPWPLRGAGLDGLLRAWAASLDWGGIPHAFPGLPELRG
ncbi:uncharacterized protein DUF4439 [Kineococcus xinjiangensis]|uniref:Uncharacterized protein DUF4439 n=1 Tax=Kineococcus xinjiangensis TaxID=512762 RepID=A0A2S6IVV6_9ACTN|nr:uncharacterized protein DUF4439 [Kineococcus xinjiangensis]